MQQYLTFLAPKLHKSKTRKKRGGAKVSIPLGTPGFLSLILQRGCLATRSDLLVNPQPSTSLRLCSISHWSRSQALFLLPRLLSTYQPSTCPFLEQSLSLAEDQGWGSGDGMTLPAGEGVAHNEEGGRESCRGEKPCPCRSHQRPFQSPWVKRTDSWWLKF